MFIEASTCMPPNPNLMENKDNNFAVQGEYELLGFFCFFFICCFYALFPHQPTWTPIFIFERIGRKIVREVNIFGRAFFQGFLFVWLVWGGGGGGGFFVRKIFL